MYLITIYTGEIVIAITGMKSLKHRLNPLLLVMNVIGFLPFCFAGLVGSAYHIVAFQPDSAIAALQRASNATVTMGKSRKLHNVYCFVVLHRYLSIFSDADLVVERLSLAT